MTFCWLSLKDLQDSHVGQAGLVLAHGPSLNKIKPHLEDFRKANGVIFGCNDWYKMYSVTPDYWVMANADINVQTECKKIHESQDQLRALIYADSADVTDRRWIEKNFNVPVLAYDQRHFQGSPCSKRRLKPYKILKRRLLRNKICCDQIIPGRLTIQEYLAKYLGSEMRYSTGNTVALHQISLAIIAGCNPIYFVGVDLDYRLGYANKSFPPDVAYFDLDKNEILRDLLTIRDAADKKGIQIKNLNMESTYSVIDLEEIERIEYFHIQDPSKAIFESRQ